MWNIAVCCMRFSDEMIENNIMKHEALKVPEARKLMLISCTYVIPNTRVVIEYKLKLTV